MGRTRCTRHSGGPRPAQPAAFRLRLAAHLTAAYIVADDHDHHCVAESALSVHPGTQLPRRHSSLSGEGTGERSGEIRVLDLLLGDELEEGGAAFTGLGDAALDGGNDLAGL